MEEVDEFGCFVTVTNPQNVRTFVGENLDILADLLQQLKIPCLSSPGSNAPNKGHVAINGGRDEKLDLSRGECVEKHADSGAREKGPQWKATNQDDDQCAEDVQDELDWCCESLDFLEKDSLGSAGRNSRPKARSHHVLPHINIRMGRSTTSPHDSGGRLIYFDPSRCPGDVSHPLGSVERLDFTRVTCHLDLTRCTM